MRTWWPSVQALAEDQSGLFTAAQAQELGATRPGLGALAESGLIERLLHGVYLVVGTPVDRFTPVRAAWLSLDPRRTAEDRLASDDPGGVVTHRTAALLLDIGELDADRHEFTTLQRRRSRSPELQLHRGDPGEWMIHEGLPVSTPGQTLATLARDSLDLDHLASAVNDATRRWGLTRADLCAYLQPSARRYGHHDIDDLLDDILVTRGNALRHTTDLLGPAGTDRLTRGIVNELLRTPEWILTVNNAMPKVQVPTPAIPNIQVPTPAIPNIQVPTPAIPNIQVPTPAIPKIEMPRIVVPGLSESLRRVLQDAGMQHAISNAFRNLGHDENQPAEPAEPGEEQVRRSRDDAEDL